MRSLSEIDIDILFTFHDFKFELRSKNMIITVDQLN